MRHKRAAQFPLPSENRLYRSSAQGGGEGVGQRRNDVEIGSGSPEVGTALTRRQFSRKVAGSAAGLLLYSAAEGQEAPAAPKETPAEADPRIASLEKERSAPLTPDQRKRLPGQLKDLDEGATSLRK